MLELLRKSELFKDCTAQEIEKVAAACESKTFKAGETVIEAQSAANTLYIVDEGCVEIRFPVTYLLGSQEVTLDRKLKGDVLGWSAIVHPHVFTLSAVAAKDSTLLTIASVDMEKLCADDHFGHVFMRNLADIIAQRFNMLQQMLIDVVQDRLKKQEPGG